MLYYNAIYNLKMFRINNISRIVDNFLPVGSKRKEEEKYAYKKGMLKCVIKQLYGKRQS
jgi:hypothetical protein